MKEIDPRALKTLLAYSLVHPEDTPVEDFAYAKAAGLCFDKVTMSHDQAVRWALKEFSLCRKEGVAASFLVGVGRNLPQLRAALPAYAVMTHFPEHPFEQSPHPYCPICGVYPEMDVDLTFVNRCRWSGTLIGRDPFILAFYLQQHNADHIGEPTQAEIQKFLEVLELIGAAPETETPTTLHKKIRKLPGIKMSVEISRHFLDTLGYAGILQTPEHRGFVDRYVGPSVPSKSHSSDWAYPVDFWTGKDGVNTDALKYWFSAYPQIANWQPK